jgi:hypothetical protein
MATVKRISDAYSIVGTTGNTNVSIGDPTLTSANLTINGNLTVSNNLTLPIYSTTSLPTVTTGSIIFVNNANSGVGTIAFGNATVWVDIKTGLAVSI